MIYNIGDIDRELANNMKGSGGKRLKETLAKKIAEQETMLDVFEVSIKHCNQQFKLCTDKAAAKQNELKRQEYDTHE